MTSPSTPTTTGPTLTSNHSIMSTIVSEKMPHSTPYAGKISSQDGQSKKEAAQGQGDSNGPPLHHQAL